MISFRKKVISLFLIFSLLVGIVGIANIDTTYAASKKIHLDKKTVVIAKGSSATQYLISKKGSFISDKKVKWKSLNTSIAKINKRGVIKPVKKGTAKMTAKYKGKTYRFTVKVTSPIKMKASASTVSLKIGEEKKIKVTLNRKCDIHLFKSINMINMDSFCECKWETWHKSDTWAIGKTAYLIVKGKAEGTGKITVGAYYGDGDMPADSLDITIDVTSNKTPAEKIYDFVKTNGYSVNSDYIIPGNRCVESSRYYGSDYTDIYIVSIDTNDSSKIYFGSYRIKPALGKYKDTTESTVLTYNINNSAGSVFFWQEYYTSDKYSSWAHYTSSGEINYANYSGASYYVNEKGITGITIGDNKTPVESGSYDSKALIEGVNAMTIGVDKLIGQLLNIRLRDIGFTQL